MQWHLEENVNCFFGTPDKSFVAVFVSQPSPCQSDFAIFCRQDSATKKTRRCRWVSSKPPWEPLMMVKDAYHIRIENEQGNHNKTETHSHQHA
jgi:hypothetical protein